MMPVFNFLVNYVLQRTHRVDCVRMNLGVGFTKTVIKTSAQPAQTALAQSLATGGRTSSR